MSYTYNLDGSVATMTYPSGAVINYTPDSAGRVLSVIDNGNPSTGTSGQAINYVTGLTYNAANAVTGSTYGQGSNFTGIVNSFSFNDRLQPVTLWSSSPDWTLMYLIYDFHLGNGDNGNVYGITNNRDISRSQAFTYDPLNRLLSAQNAGTDCTQKLPDGHTAYWGNSYVYDAWGNLNQKLVTKCSAENLSVTVSANNQLQGGYAYDVAGNMMRDNNGKNYVYDAENRIAGAVGFTYTYDADGNRVEKVNGTTGTLYWYMTPGIVAESDLLGNLQSEYVFFDGERVARKDIPENNVSYYFSDHLKTAALISDSVGNIQSESDYYPWGGELQFSNNDPNHYKFTGKERDAETGLDYFGARYYSNGLGRFVTPDWSATPVPVPYADLTDPQTLNQYSYVRNLPTSRYDKDGHCGDAITCGAEIGAGIGTLVEPGGGTAVGAGVGIAVGVVVDVGLAGYWVYKHFFSNSNKVPPPPPPVPQANANAQAPIPPGQQQHNEQNNNREQQKGSQEQARGRAQYENPGHHDAQSQNFIKGKTPLPKDAEAVYNSAIEDTNRAPGTSQTYYGRSANGQFYRYQGQNGKVHWNGTIKPNKVPSAIRTKLLGGQG
jgi:RHS repeat-associated protein